MHKRNFIVVKRGVDFQNLKPANLTLSLEKNDLDSKIFYNEMVIPTTIHAYKGTWATLPQYATLKGITLDATNTVQDFLDNEVYGKGITPFVVYEGDEETKGITYTTEPFALEMKQMVVEIELNGLEGILPYTDKTTIEDLFTVIVDDLNNSARTDEVNLVVTNEGHFVTSSIAGNMNAGEDWRLGTIKNAIILGVDKKQYVPETGNPTTRKREPVYVATVLFF